MTTSTHSEMKFTSGAVFNDAGTATGTSLHLDRVQLCVPMYNAAATSCPKDHLVCFYDIGTTYLKFKQSGYNVSNLLGNNAFTKYGQYKVMGKAFTTIASGATGIIVLVGAVQVSHIGTMATGTSYVRLATTLGKAEAVALTAVVGTRRVFGLVGNSTAVTAPGPCWAMIWPWRL